MHFFHGVVLLEILNEAISMHLIRIFPLVLGIRIPEPLDKVLKFTPSSEPLRV